MRQDDAFASTQILAFNPIMQESPGVRRRYYQYLRDLIRLIKWDKRKYTKAQLVFYKETLCGAQEASEYAKAAAFPDALCFLVPYDLALMLAFQKRALSSENIHLMIDRIMADFSLPPGAAAFLLREFQASMGDEEAWSDVLANERTKVYQHYLTIVRENTIFVRKTPYVILITATMSAGKSTLINALTGKNVCRTQNLACTSKIHGIISKSFEDHVTSENDHDLSMSASAEALLTNSEENHSAKISVATYFRGRLGGQRLILNDSPGINYSQDPDHCAVTRKMIHAKKYDLLIYVLNARNLGSTAEAVHLAYVKSQLGRRKVLFVLNQIDWLSAEDGTLFQVIEDQRMFLISMGFRDPIICPVSSTAAYWAKKSLQEPMSARECRKMETYSDIFNENCAASYYETHLHCPPLSCSTGEAETLLKNCGFSYLEELIKYLSNGGKMNGTGLC